MDRLIYCVVLGHIKFGLESEYNMGQVNNSAPVRLDLIRLIQIPHQIVFHFSGADGLQVKSTK